MIKSKALMAAALTTLSLSTTPAWAELEPTVRGAFDNSPFFFFPPAGTYNSVAPDGTPYSTTLNPDFSYVMKSGDETETGRWTVDGALTCMSPSKGNVHARVSGLTTDHSERVSRCFVITDDTSIKTCPQPRTDFPPRPINCVVAARPGSDGERTLTLKDGRQSRTGKRDQIADLPGDPADRSAFLFESPVGSWETTTPDGSKRVTIHNADFTSENEAGELIGYWTSQGGLTCMIRAAAANQMTCFAISEDPNQECPKLGHAPEVERVNCVIASPLREDGTRTLTSPDGSVSVTRRVN